jgi:hypothetical protein
MDCSPVSNRDYQWRKNDSAEMENPRALSFLSPPFFFCNKRGGDSEEKQLFLSAIYQNLRKTKLPPPPSWLTVDEFIWVKDTVQRNGFWLKKGVINRLLTALAWMWKVMVPECSVDPMIPQKTTLDSLRTLSRFVSYQRLSPKFQSSPSAVTVSVRYFYVVQIIVIFKTVWGSDEWRFSRMCFHLNRWENGQYNNSSEDPVKVYKPIRFLFRSKIIYFWGKIYYI